MRAPARVLAALLLGGWLGPPARAPAQELERAISLLAAENARRYARPVTVAIGSTLNAGFLYTAATHEPLGFDVGIHVQGSRVAENDLTFEPLLPDSVVIDGLVMREPYGAAGGSRSATALGDGAGIVLTPQNEYRAMLQWRGIDPARRNLRFPDGLGFSTAPFAFIQAGLGVGLHTDVVIRFIPSLTLRQDIGAVSMVGFGLKHSVDQWFSESSPVRVAVFGNLHHLRTGDYADARAGQVGVAASGEVTVLTLLGALAYEDTRVSVDYVLRNPGDLPGRPADGTLLSFEDGDGNLRATLGVALRLASARLATNISVGPYTTLDLGLIFTER